MPSAGDMDIRDWLTGTIGNGMRLGLSTCAEMLDRLGNPQLDFPSVHVAGTNGKGSLCANLSALGARNGELIGLFTSPHLACVEERARVDGKPVLPSEFDLYLEQVRGASLIEPQIRPTYFEVTFLASMLAFSKARVDRAIVETGLGGRLDSTRLVEADICAITTISRDHTEILGETLGGIATEKAGIHRQGVPILCLFHEDVGVRDALESVAGSDLEWIANHGGDAQGTARLLSEEIGKRLGWKPLETELTWAGRTNDPISWSGVECRISAAHNEESLAHDMGAVSGEDHVLVLGMTQKEDLESSIKPLVSSIGRVHVIVTRVDGGRNPSVPIESLARILSENGSTEVDGIADTSDAMDHAARIARKHDCFVYVTGSIYLVGQILSELADREGTDIWESLTIHPPREGTEE
ncbi:MAG TPA: hypothetical protein QF641_02020 [Candidatus Thalassarchaeaceae archaeon]|jgi:folylpolyglutamate synthase/dihydropteroate synthase|nr:hypothetical protein [Candidatus Thalassarchaeaceae archaeon]|tara:strand:- start:19909 stop:21144 length:1236 start_codon:yes stop_codon:yes gene_type:complete